MKAMKMPADQLHQVTVGDKVRWPAHKTWADVIMVECNGRRVTVVDRDGRTYSLNLTSDRERSGSIVHGDADQALVKVLSSSSGYPKYYTEFGHKLGDRGRVRNPPESGADVYDARRNKQLGGDKRVDRDFFF